MMDSRAMAIHVQVKTLTVIHAVSLHSCPYRDVCLVVYNDYVLMLNEQMNEYVNKYSQKVGCFCPG